jgi:hypothetical protein
MKQLFDVWWALPWYYKLLLALPVIGLIVALVWSRVYRAAGVASLGETKRLWDDIATDADQRLDELDAAREQIKDQRHDIDSKINEALDESRDRAIDLDNATTPSDLFSVYRRLIEWADS